MMTYSKFNKPKDITMKVQDLSRELIGLILFVVLAMSGSAQTTSMKQTIKGIVHDDKTGSDWVDMGGRTKDGDIIYWSATDFLLKKNGSVGLVRQGEVGSYLYWGDITGFSSVPQNPPTHIEGNPNYDIVTAKLGKPYRLPTDEEFKQLALNVTTEKASSTIERQGKNGLPSWVQGQWQWTQAILAGGQAHNISISLKIDGYLASVYTSENEYWEGTYSYSDSTLNVWELTLNLDKTNHTLVDDRGYMYQKTSDGSKFKTTTEFVMTSKINGNKLHFPLPQVQPQSMGTSHNGRAMIVLDNNRNACYWSGTYMTQDERAEYDGALALIEQPYDSWGLALVPIHERQRIRAVWVDVGSGKRLAEEKRQREIEAAAARERERQRQAEIRAAFVRDSIAESQKVPMVRVLDLLCDTAKTNGLFDFEIHRLYKKELNFYTGRFSYKLTGSFLVIKANKNTEKFYKEFMREAAPIYKRPKTRGGMEVRKEDNYSLFVVSNKGNDKKFVEDKWRQCCHAIQNLLNGLTLRYPSGGEKIETKFFHGYDFNYRFGDNTTGMRSLIDGKILIGDESYSVEISNIPFLVKKPSPKEILYIGRLHNLEVPVFLNGIKIKERNVYDTAFYEDYLYHKGI